MPQGSDLGTLQAKLPNYYPSRMDKEFLQSLGKFGGIYIDNTNAVNFDARGVSAIYALSAAVVDTLVGNIKGGKLESGGESMALPAGATIMGFFTKLKLASGTVIAYYANPADQVL